MRLSYFAEKALLVYRKSGVLSANFPLELVQGGATIVSETEDQKGQLTYHW